MVDVDVNVDVGCSLYAQITEKPAQISLTRQIELGWVGGGRGQRWCFTMRLEHARLRLAS